ncbi:MAG: hypothetical protein JXA57_07625, partial [Armatimonadetes bacterium]|nr:hypothetical protein [Armatimonadota bacterium]
LASSAQQSGGTDVQRPGAERRPPVDSLSTAAATDLRRRVTVAYDFLLSLWEVTPGEPQAVDKTDRA